VTGGNSEPAAFKPKAAAPGGAFPFSSRISFSYDSGDVTDTSLNTTWKDVVRDALVKLGGQGHLKDINKLVKNHPKTRTNPTWEDTIRRVVRQYTIFQPIPPNRSGLYRLAEQPNVSAEPESLSEKSPVDHGTAQGMLLTLGRMYGYETFAPAPDRTSRSFQGKSLADFSTVTDCATFCGKNSLARVRQIDAMWLAEDNDGVYPVYAFEVEHTTGVRSGMDRLVELPERYAARLFVVAPGEDERSRFDGLIRLNKFRKFRERLWFRNYTELDTLYNSAVKHEEDSKAFGVEPR
jgi:hypothetical protein